MTGRARRLAHDERRDLAEFLASISPQEWQSPTPCEGWSVTDVVAHLISYDELDLRDLVTHIVRGRLDSRRINAATMARLSTCDPPQLLQLLRTHLEPRGLMSLVGGRIALLEGVVHHQDIRRALGRPRTIPPDRLLLALRSALLAPDVGSFWRVRGVRLVATDLDFSWGVGPEVFGPGESLLMTIAGRHEAVGDLTGPGQPKLAERIVGSNDDAVPQPTIGLTPEQAGRVYDRIGRLQDSQRLYETPAVTDLISGARLGDARAVYELGCGTGALAARLLAEVLPSTAHYRGVDVSAKMVALTAGRIEPYGERASVERVDGRPPLPGDDASYDRFLALYVLDLLDESSALALLDDAHRLLAPDGLLCLVSLTHGTTTASRALCRVWNSAWQRSPSLVGGCRPIDLAELLDGWDILHDRTIVTWAVPSQVIIATPGPVDR